MSNQGEEEKNGGTLEGLPGGNFAVMRIEGERRGARKEEKKKVPEAQAWLNYGLPRFHSTGCEITLLTCSEGATIFRLVCTLYWHSRPRDLLWGSSSWGLLLRFEGLDWSAPALNGSLSYFVFQEGLQPRQAEKQLVY